MKNNKIRQKELQRKFLQHTNSKNLCYVAHLFTFKHIIIWKLMSHLNRLSTVPHYKMVWLYLYNSRNIFLSILFQQQWQNFLSLQMFFFKLLSPQTLGSNRSSGLRQEIELGTFLFFMQIICLYSNVGTFQCLGYNN